VGNPSRGVSNLGRILRVPFGSARHGCPNANEEAGSNALTVVASDPNVRGADDNAGSGNRAARVPRFDDARMEGV